MPRVVCETREKEDMICTCRQASACIVGLDETELDHFLFEGPCNDLFLISFRPYDQYSDLTYSWRRHSMRSISVNRLGEQFTQSFRLLDKRYQAVGESGKESRSEIFETGVLEEGGFIS